MGKEKTVAADLEGARPLLNKVRKCGLNLARLTSVCDQEAYPLRIRRDLHFSRFGLRVDWISRVAEITNRCSLRYQLQQQPNTLRRCFRGQEAYASQIFSRPVEAVHKPDLNGIGALHENNRNRLGRCLGCKCAVCALEHNDYRYLTANQFVDQRRQPIISTLSPAVVNDHVLAFDITGLLQTSAEYGEILSVRFNRCEVKKPDHWHS